MTDDNKKEEKNVRLNKAIADAGICSRRKADDLISSGKVSVNGKPVVELGLRVVPGKDEIKVNGRQLDFSTQGHSYSYLLLHKPVQVVSTSSDPEGRQTVLELLPEIYKKKRMYPVGRLDYFSEGAILLTDDGDLTHRLTHPRFHLPKVYQVTLREKPTKEALQIMRNGMTLAEGEKLAPVDVDLLSSNRDISIVEMILRQGINRQIRRMCRDLGLTILKLVRVGFGPLSLGDLPLGACRELMQEEVSGLRKAVGL